MSQQDNQALETPTLPSEEDVIAFLEVNPDFLARNPQLLEILELHHATGPAAVSLIERQIEVMRGKNARLEDRLRNLTGTAEDNQRRAGNVHRLARTLVRAPTLANVVRGLTRVMREDFDIDAVFVGVNAPTLKRHDIEGLTRIDTRSRINDELSDFLRTRLIECGPISEKRAKILFPETEAVRSAAIVPLEKENGLGILAFGSCDLLRFQPKQGKLFLEMTAELVAAALRARLG